MSWFGGMIGGRSLMYLAAPLLVIGTLWWRGQVGFAPSEKVISDASVSSGGRPAGVSAEEWKAARLDFEALTDGTLRCDAQEMPAYWRLLKWSAGQFDSERDSNLFSRVSFNDLVNRPNELRGAPVQVDLQVCRISSYAAPENSLGIQRLYEVWGWSEDSRGSLYVAITSELPAGMHIGEVVSEQATLRGYFYKIQGYLAAGSGSQGQQSAAPLIIGRVQRRLAPVAAFAKSNELWLGGAGLLLAASFVWLLSQRPLFRFPHRQSLEPLAPNAAAKLDAWLDSPPALLGEVLSSP